MHLREIGVAWIVGAIWGITNPLIKRGSENVNVLHGQNSLIRHLATPSFILPQLANKFGSALFILLLGQDSSELSRVAPLANGLNLGFTALTDIVLGESFELSYLIPGLVLLFIGVLLCS
jgi:hypothetical protein